MKNINCIACKPRLPLCLISISLFCNYWHCNIHGLKQRWQISGAHSVPIISLKELQKIKDKQAAVTLTWHLTKHDTQREIYGSGWAQTTDWWTSTSRAANFSREGPGYGGPFATGSVSKLNTVSEHSLAAQLIHLTLHHTARPLQMSQIAHDNS